MSDTGKKFDTGKLRFDLIQPEFESELAAVLTFGAQKYEPNNWQCVNNPVERYYAALQRHINHYRCGEAFDPETGLSHLAHAACNLMFLSHFHREELQCQNCSPIMTLQLSLCLVQDNPGGSLSWRSTLLKRG